jgi:glycosyltransferase involved in cell wall biosynthesis
LLSICIPSYKGADYLRVSLEALLPQVLQAGGRAEVLVIDDTSPDNTGDVVEQAQQFGPVRYIRNPANLGSARNIVHGPLQHATGEFLCILSQHCLVYPGALQKLLALLERKRNIDAFYINFRCASYPEQWPRQAIAGYSGEFHYLANTDLQDHEVARWEDLLDARTCVCTQSYAHVFKRAIWVQYWTGRTLGAHFEDAQATYPTTCALAENMFGKPSYYIGEPMLTIFNGAQWWGSFAYRAKAFMRGYPDLLRLYQRLGWSGEKLREAQAWGATHAGAVMAQLFHHWRPEEGKLFARYVIKCWNHRGLFPSIGRALVESECCWLARAIPRLRLQMIKCHRYWLYNCRPARWIRARRQAR